jgi:hypothetical protein
LHHFPIKIGRNMSDNKIIGFAIILTSLVLWSQNTSADSTWTAYTTMNSPLPTDLVSGIDFDGDGNQYVGTTGGGVVHIRDSVWTVWDQSNTGVPINSVRLATRDSQGNLWLGAASGNLDASPFGFGVAFLDGIDSTWSMVNHGLEVNQIVTGIMFDDSLRYVSTYGGGVTAYSDSGWIRYRYNTRTEFRYADSSLQVFDVPPGTYIPSDYIRAMDEDVSAGCVWFATADGGAVRKTGSVWETFNTSNSGLPSNQLWSVKVNQVNGNVSFGTAGFGVGVLSGGNWTVYNSGNSPFDDNYIASLGVKPSGDELWIGTGTGVWVRENNGTWRAYLPDVNNFISGQFYSDIAFDSSGKAWVSAYGGGMASLFLDTLPPPPDTLDISVGRMFIFFFDNRPVERIFTSMSVMGAPDLANDDTITYRLESNAGELYNFSVPFGDFDNHGRSGYRYKQNKLTVFLKMSSNDPPEINISIKDMDAGMNRENYSDTLTLTLRIGDIEGSVVVYLVEGNQIYVAGLYTEDEADAARVFGTFPQEPDKGRPEEILPQVNNIGLINYPNPFNARTMISFSIPEGGDVDIAVFDILGRQVSNIYSGYLSPGSHEYPWPGVYGQAPKSGIYYYRVIYNGQSRTGKMMYLK